MSTKRRSDKDLNHENWNEEEEPEEQGEFVKASDDELKKRKILQPKRRSEAGSVGPANPFGSLTLSTAAAAPPSAVPEKNSETKSTENGSTVAAEKEKSAGANDSSKTNKKDGEDKSEDEGEGQNGENSESEDSDEDENSSSSSNLEEAAEVGQVNNVLNSDSDEEEDIDSDDDEDVEDEEDDDSESDENASDGDE